MHPLLSARQEQCLRLTAFRTDKEIAAYLGISEATVKKHVHEACQRLGVNRRKAALALLDPIVPDAPEKASAGAAEGYPKHPIARLAVDDHASPEAQEGIDENSADVPAPASTNRDNEPSNGRHGYRAPPGSPVLRIVLIVAGTIVLAALVVMLVTMLGDMHEAVGKIDAAATAGST